MKSYALGTFDVDRWRYEGVKQATCWAFFVIGSKAEVIPWSTTLDLEINDWIVRGQFALGYDLVAETCVDFAKEVQAKRWELQRLGLTTEWSSDLIPGAPSASKTLQNAFETEEEFDQALIKPIDLKEHWTPPSELTPHTSSSSRHVQHFPGHVPVSLDGGDRPAVPIRIPEMH